MKNKNLALASLFLALGVLLHSITPGIFGMMKPDFLCVMFFISLMLMDTVQEMIAVTLACALLAALTTSIPGGQIANIVDKLMCGPVIFLVYRQLKNHNSFVLTGAIATFGTMLSGLLFLGTLSFMGALPQSFLHMLLIIVIPTALINSCVFYVLINTSLFKNMVQVHAEKI